MSHPDPNLAAPELHDFTECAAFCKAVAGKASGITRLGIAMSAILVGGIVAWRRSSVRSRI